MDAEATKAKYHHLNEQSGPVFKIKDDPRLTKIGKFIRKFSIDELPQLFNVLMGSMTLIGPCPPIPSEVIDYEDDHMRRLSMKPGITGLWQVTSRNKVDFDKWLKLINADIVCLQEIKANVEQFDESVFTVLGYDCYWNSIFNHHVIKQCCF